MPDLKGHLVPRPARGRRGLRATVAASMVALLIPAAPTGAYERPGRTEVVSVSSAGEQGGFCRPQDVPTQFCPESPAAHTPFASSLSASGRFVAFASGAGGLVPGDNNGHTDVFVRDRRKGTTRIASVSSTGQIAVGHAGGGVEGVSVGPKYYGSQGGGWTMALSYDPSISADGRYVAFTSAAANLVIGDTNAAVDVFVHDLRTGNTERVSVNSQGREGQLDLTTVRPEALAHGSAVPDSFYPSISANGRFVSFTSFASNFAEGKDENGWADVFVHDRKTGKTERVSLSSGGGEAEMYVCLSQLFSCKPWSPRSSISSNGRWVVFDSVAPDHIEGDTNELPDVFVHDRRTGKNERISVGSNGEEAFELTPQLGWSGAGSSLTGASPFYTAGRAISNNGRYVTFVSRSENLVPDDNNRDPVVTGAWYAGQDVFVHDRNTKRTHRVSVTSVGQETDLVGKNMPLVGTIGYQYPSISATGRFIAFQGAGLVEGRFKEALGIYVHDRQTGATEFTSPMTIDHDGQTRWVGGAVPDISASGRFVSFASGGWPEGRKDADKTDGTDFFVRDRGEIVGAGSSGSPGSPEDEEPLICIEDLCLPPGAVARATGVDRRATDTLGPEDIDLLGASVAYRRSLSDLFLRIDVKRLPGLRTGPAHLGDPSLVHGARFEIDGSKYELRAAAAPAHDPAIGLFSCDGRLCTELLRLEGGYGTTGERIVASVPLHALGLENGGRISSLEVFSALGTYVSGPQRVRERLGFR